VVNLSLKLQVGTVVNAVFIHFILLPSRKLFTLNSTNSNLSSRPPNCFCAIYAFHLFPFLNTHMFCKCQNVEKNRAVPTKGFLECKTVANRKINFFSFFQKAMWYFSKLSGWRDAHHTRPVDQARHSFAYERINNLIVV
jgi:hypothetical protein